MVESGIDNKRLPLERPLGEALLIYAKRLGIFGGIVLVNLVSLALTLSVIRWSDKPLLIFAVIYTLTILCALFIYSYAHKRLQIAHLLRMSQKIEQSSTDIELSGERSHIDKSVIKISSRAFEIRLKRMDELLQEAEQLTRTLEEEVAKSPAGMELPQQRSQLEKSLKWLDELRESLRAVADNLSVES